MERNSKNTNLNDFHLMKDIGKGSFLWKKEEIAKNLKDDISKNINEIHSIHNELEKILLNNIIIIKPLISPLIIFWKPTQSSNFSQEMCWKWNSIQHFF